MYGEVFAAGNRKPNSQRLKHYRDKITQRKESLEGGSALSMEFQGISSLAVSSLGWDKAAVPFQAPERQ